MTAQKIQEPKQQLLFEFVEDAIIESLYSKKEPEPLATGDAEYACPECDSTLDVSYDDQYNPQFYCDNCDCAVSDQGVMSLEDKD
ncbi:MAG TPA: hypothetical protein VJP79_06510 [Nitrososphaera sp.]|nr:hypothetical protein [Nitrososphaera sp.]